MVYKVSIRIPNQITNVTLVGDPPHDDSKYTIKMKGSDKVKIKYSQ